MPYYYSWPSLPSWEWLLANNHSSLLDLSPPFCWRDIVHHRLSTALYHLWKTTSLTLLPHFNLSNHIQFRNNPPLKNKWEEGQMSNSCVCANLHHLDRGKRFWREGYPPQRNPNLHHFFNWHILIWIGLLSSASMRMFQQPTLRLTVLSLPLTTAAFHVHFNQARGHLLC